MSHIDQIVILDNSDKITIPNKILKNKGVVIYGK